MQPGQCWAFKGTQGYLVLQLSTAVKPTAFSMEHIPRALSPSGKIDSAPKDFSVWVSRARGLIQVIFNAAVKSCVRYIKGSGCSWARRVNISIVSFLQGLDDEHDTQGLNLGNFTYDQNKDPLQFFPVKVSHYHPSSSK